MTREIVICVKILNQVAVADVETGQDRNIVMYAPDLDSTLAQFYIEERVYRLERDEEAMLARIKNTNIRATGVDSFLNQRLGPMADLQGDQPMSLNSIIDKRRVFVESKLLSTGQPFLLQALFDQSSLVAAADQDFKCRVDAKCSLQGVFRVCSSDFTRMPKGSITLQIAAYSQF